MNDLFLDIGYQSLHKDGEILCGDHIEVVSSGPDSTTLVLADGLGSGVKASILSTLTSTILSTMMANNMALTDCVAAIAATLPVCSEREIAYSTFTIVHIIKNRQAEIIQYDNPHVILLRGGKHWEFPKSAETIEGKTIYKSRLTLEENDTFVLISDGAEYASEGIHLNRNWKRSDIITFLERLYKDEYAAKSLTTFLLDQCNVLYGGKPGDDTTVCTLKIRRRQPMNLMVGPPRNREDEPEMLGEFLGKEGKHIVCGGTTASIVAKYLGKEMNTALPDDPDCEIPPIAFIDGVDLVTEGAITLNRVLRYARDYLGENNSYGDWSTRQDGASQMARMLFEEATDIRFYAGQAVNAAHQEIGMPAGLSNKQQLVQDLVNTLEKMGKQVSLCSY